MLFLIRVEIIMVERKIFYFFYEYMVLVKKGGYEEKEKKLGVGIGFKVGG